MKLKRYRPSNGTEGELFYAKWCAHCVWEAAAREGDGFAGSDGCEILARSMSLDIDDHEYPDQWREDGPSGPRCTAFSAEGDDPVTPFDPAAAIGLLL